MVRALLKTASIPLARPSLAALAQAQHYASRSPRSARATSQRKTPTARVISVSARQRPPARSATGYSTVPGKGYFGVLRLYSPTEATIDKNWKPGDIEEVN